jgi:hypothetical protein
VPSDQPSRLASTFRALLRAREQICRELSKEGSWLTALHEPEVVPFTPLPCVGDCAPDRMVTIDEIIVGVNIALGMSPLDACAVFDAAGDGHVTVEELIVAVSNAPTGCR